MMTYALLQKTMDAPPVDALRRAFRQSSALSSADAMAVADDAFGILARDIPEDEVQNLAARLMAEGIDTEVVAENQLPRLPEARFFLSPQITDNTLDLFDALQCTAQIPWGALRLIAVGHDRREVRIELIGGDAVLRYFTTIDRLHFTSAPEVANRSSAARFVHLVRKLHEHAPNAWLNRGAAALIQEAVPDRIEELVAYPRASAFIEEMTWLLWKARVDDDTRTTASDLE